MGYHVIGENKSITEIVGDQIAVFFGQACFDQGMSKNTCGTGWQGRKPSLLI
ncbi:glycerol kinase [Alkalihalobacillus xiaoxiensis]|uniref:Glycerol kinase n=1 Tax=Shouchella xiaoxiensis TaxID=766895 RepID=A0ABS2SPJ4_9BACI|nr:glycerol kinase [Shouchella xiaoxiensis]